MMKNRKVLTCLIVALAVVLIGALAAIPLTGGGGEDPTDSSTQRPQILELRLNGPQLIILEYGQALEDPGAELYLDGRKVEGTVTVELPELTVLGTWEMVYTGHYEGETVQIRRQIRVQDTVAPELLLMTDPSYCPEIGEEYLEEGYLATDNYDGDLTEQVTWSREGDVITYTVSDSSGNTATATRNLVFGDSVAPVITLNGEETVYLIAGTSFQDPGCTAVDNVDGDLSAQVQITGGYDKYLPGTYSLTYTVTDAHGNSATAVRKVVVEGRTQPDVVVPGDKVIYLTFDDGPSGHTPKLLEVLAKYNVRATFFVVGNSRLDLLDDIVDAGHAIGVHSNSHEYSEIYASEDAFFQDFWTVWNIIKERTGVETTLMRFPGGSSNRVSKQYCTGIMTRLTQAVEAMGFQYFDWNVTSGDAGDTKDTDQIFHNVTEGIRGKDYAIVLQHDIFGYSVDAVERIIQWGLANGYQFQVLDSTSPNAHHEVKN